MNPSDALALGFAEEINNKVNNQRFKCPFFTSLTCISV